MMFVWIAGPSKSCILILLLWFHLFEVVGVEKPKTIGVPFWYGSLHTAPL